MAVLALADRTTVATGTTVVCDSGDFATIDKYKVSSQQLGQLQMAYLLDAVTYSLKMLPRTPP